MTIPQPNPADEVSARLQGYYNGPQDLYPVAEVNDLRRFHRQQSAEIDRLTKELEAVKKGYESLDKNWQAVHESAMESVCTVIGLPKEYEGGRIFAIAALVETIRSERDVALARAEQAERECGEWKPRYEGMKAALQEHCTKLEKRAEQAEGKLAAIEKICEERTSRRGDGLIYSSAAIWPRELLSILHPPASTK